MMRKNWCAYNKLLLSKTLKCLPLEVQRFKLEDLRDESQTTKVARYRIAIMPFLCRGEDTDTTDVMFSMLGASKAFESVLSKQSRQLLLGLAVVPIKPVCKRQS